MKPDLAIVAALWRLDDRIRAALAHGKAEGLNNLDMADELRRIAARLDAPPKREQVA